MLWQKPPQYAGMPHEQYMQTADGKKSQQAFQQWGQWQQNNMPTPSKPGPGRPSAPMRPQGMTPSRPGPGRPSVPMTQSPWGRPADQQPETGGDFQLPAELSPYAPGRAQSQQSPYAKSTSYGGQAGGQQTPGYGTPQGQRGQMRTAEFRDRDFDGVDDRDQDGPGGAAYGLPVQAPPRQGPYAAPSQQGPATQQPPPPRAAQKRPPQFPAGYSVALPPGLQDTQFVRNLDGSYSQAGQAKWQPRSRPPVMRSQQGPAQGGMPGYGQPQEPSGTPYGNPPFQSAQMAMRDLQEQPDPRAVPFQSTMTGPFGQPADPSTYYQQQQSMIGNIFNQLGNAPQGTWLGGGQAPAWFMQPQDFNPAQMWQNAARQRLG